MNTEIRVQEVKRAVQLINDYNAGKEVTGGEFVNALANALIQVERLTAANYKLKQTARKHSIKEKQRERNTMSRFYNLA